MIGAYLANLRVNGVLACASNHYSNTSYMSYCNAGGYADYDHGAFWFGLEPEALDAAAAADVLFLGNSRVQFGLSTDATSDWFAAANASYYLLGFAYAENVRFTAPLLKELKPRARVYVINVDDFFDDVLTEPVADIFSSTDALRRYRGKQAWQAPHRVVCGKFPALCGDERATFRETGNGTWKISSTNGLRPAAAGHAPAQEQGSFDIDTLGEPFLTQLPVAPECILLTLVPWELTASSRAIVIAEELGLPLIAPFMNDLETFDGSHLEPGSAQRWASAFFAAAGPSIQRCLNDETAALQ
jgi:hypothetical protein